MCFCAICDDDELRICSRLFLSFRATCCCGEKQQPESMTLNEFSLLVRSHNSDCSEQVICVPERVETRTLRLNFHSVNVFGRKNATSYISTMLRTPADGRSVPISTRNLLGDRSTNKVKSASGVRQRLISGLTDTWWKLASSQKQNAKNRATGGSTRPVIVTWSSLCGSVN